MNKERIIDYLYGELDDQARVLFEQELIDNPALKKEVEDLSHVRHFLLQSQDLEPADIPTRKATTRKVVLGRWWFAAAAILILLVAGKLLNLQLEVSADRMLLSYGTPSEEPTLPVVPDYNKLLNMMAHLDARVAAKPDSATIHNLLNTEFKSRPSQLSPTDLRSLRQQQADLARQTSEQIQLQQQAYVREVVNDLIQYWDARRSEEMQLINAGLDNIAQRIQFNDDELLSFQSSENL